MRIHIIGTITGQTNEGMRNVATHLANEFKKINSVQTSQLRNIFAIIQNSIKSDVTYIFARANKRVYWLCRLVEKLCPKMWIVLVQKPDNDFQRLNNKRQLFCNWLYISDVDAANIECRDGYVKYHFQIGIDVEKFRPVSQNEVKNLRNKYGIPCDKPLIVHVGHCSSGRGLTDFLEINGSVVERLVVASGMFEDEMIVKKLKTNGVRLLTGYIDKIEEIYQMADIYLFPTRLTEYVISVPLSVMEALACGTPVIVYKSFNGLKTLNCKEKSITYIKDSSNIQEMIGCVAQRKSSKTLLNNPKTWTMVAKELLALNSKDKQ